MNAKSVVLFFSLLVNALGYALAQGNAGIYGIITDMEQQPIIGATVFIEELNRGGVSDINGKFSILNVPYDGYTITINSVGYKKMTEQIVFKSSIDFGFQMDEDVQQLENVVIQSNEESNLIKLSGFNVNVIGVEAYQDLNLDINQILQVSSGVNVRESGGLGSNFDLSLNGLSGNQIRYFIDGIPMENFGSAMTLNNFPSNMIRSIEVYKGVVPISLASDALGGSINVNTPSAEESFLDASYSFGAFNTHRASVFGQHATPNGLFFRVTSFFNHSDNNYWMNHAPVTDDFGNILGEVRTRRFHNEYTSGLLNVKAGLIEKKFADELSFSFSYAKNSNNIQHPEVSINRVFGGLNTISGTYLGNCNYEKEWDRLKISANGLIGQSIETVYDTLSRRHNWQQEYTELSNSTSVSPGEFYDQKSIFRITDDMLRGNINLAYPLVDRHTLNANLSHNEMRRKGEDDINLNNHSFSNPNNTTKNIFGLSYNYVSKNDKLKTSAFGKQYWYVAEINAEEYVNDSYQNVRNTASFTNLGYGLTASYSLSQSWLVKASYEKAYRLPNPDEILGDGIFIDPSPNLTAESSYNINLGTSYKKHFDNSSFKSETNLFFRPAENFIRLVNERGIFGKYHNVSNVRILGIESSNTLNLNKKYAFGLNWTYQNLTDRTRFDEGLENTNYGQKVPNTPYFFWNFSAGYHLKLSEKRQLSCSWSTRYIHEFFLYWANLGYEDSKNQISTQLTHDLDINYPFQQGKYNISASAKNIFDAEAYDNFNIQKPGRAFYLKFRYFISKN